MIRTGTIINVELPILRAQEKIQNCRGDRSSSGQNLAESMHHRRRQVAKLFYIGNVFRNFLCKESKTELRV